jgi:hypothetical protein
MAKTAESVMTVVGILASAKVTAKRWPWNEGAHSATMT